MDSKRNWILVEASTSGSATPIHIRGSHRRNAPLMEKFRDEARLHTINRLNEKIHQRIMDNYCNGTTESIGEGAKVVDESFRFIDDDQGRLNSRQVEAAPFSNTSDRLDSFISHRNSQGEIEAVYERRLPSTSSRDDILQLQPILRPPRSFEEPVYIKPATRPVKNRNSTSSQMKPRMGLRRNGRDSRYRHTDSTAENIRYWRTGIINQHRRADSLDSGSLRIQRHHPLPRWSVHPEQYSYYGKFHAIEDTQRETWAEEHRPTFLRRTPQFYDKCDLCAFSIVRAGDFCPACGRHGTSTRLSNRSDDVGAYLTEQVLSAKNLNAYLQNDHLYSPTSKIYSTEFRKFYPTTSRSPPPRQTRSPVYRYGPTIPEAMYDYSVWAKRQDRQALTMHAAILALVLFSTAFVVSAGVILLVTVT